MISVHAAQPCQIDRWPSTTGLRPLAFDRWPSTAGLRPLAFDPAVYAQRNVVERYTNRLKRWRGLATRYEKRAASYRAMVVIASIVLWLEDRL